MTMNDTFPHLNPDRPMTFLPPYVAVAYTAGMYVVAAVIGVSETFVSRMQTTTLTTTNEIGLVHGRVFQYT